MPSLQSHFSRCICFHSIISSVLHEVQKNQLVTFFFISLINDESFLSIILIIREHIHISSSFTSMHEKKVRKMSSSDTYVHYSIFLPLNQQVIIIIIFGFFFLRQSMTFYTFFWFVLGFCRFIFSRNYQHVHRLDTVSSMYVL
jgi:hypothetical protein